MLKVYRRYRLLTVNIVYWFLLLYIIAALVWWYIALGQQSRRMAAYELAQVHATLDSAAKPDAFRSALSEVKDHEHMRNVEYTGEGGTFLGLILVLALFVYRVIRREMQLSGQQQNFLMAVTHELKTPIAVAKLSLETLAKRKLTEEQQAKLIHSALEETERLNQLSGNILLAAQLEDGRFTPVEEIIHLSDKLEDLIQSFSRRFPGRLTNPEIKPGLTLRGDPLLLELAISNLIENALKYSPKEEPVSIRLFREGRMLRLQVVDQGEGIPDDQKSLVFRKFYRRGDEQTRKTKGTGLGLYLSRAIVAKHGGHISVTDNHPRGSIFTVTFKEG
jgi:two-component system sensor histidine kinase CiaH